MTICLQELQGTLENTGHRITGIIAPVPEPVWLVVLQRTYRCVAVGAGEVDEFFLCQIFELILLRAHCEDRLWTITHQLARQILQQLYYYCNQYYDCVHHVSYSTACLCMSYTAAIISVQQSISTGF